MNSPLNTIKNNILIYVCVYVFIELLSATKTIISQGIKTHFKNMFNWFCGRGIIRSKARDCSSFLGCHSHVPLCKAGCGHSKPTLAMRHIRLQLRSVSSVRQCYLHQPECLLVLSGMSFWSDFLFTKAHNLEFHSNP